MIGIYFGSFNPMHKGHCHVINTALKTTISKLYCVVSPQSPFKPLSELAPYDDRLAMANLTKENNGWGDRVEIADWEKHLYPSYTAHTLQKEIPLLKDDKVTIFMGLDNFLTIDKWREFEYILENFGIYIVLRGDENAEELIHLKINEFKSKGIKIKSINYNNLMERVHLSATSIRERLSNGEDVGNDICESVKTYIEEKKLYKK
jgi:nicotinate-nucleotide adenylyltransferase